MIAPDSAVAGAEKRAASGENDEQTEAVATVAGKTKYTRNGIAFSCVGGRR